MKTPKEYTENINKKILTKNMLTDCLLSVNKRAKNCRDKEKKYRNAKKDKYNNEENYREKKNQYYSQKEKLLKLFTPNCIHKETQTKRTRIYDYEPEYDEYFDKNNYIHEGYYFDVITDECISFIDVLMTKDNYYLYYDMGDCSFHTPIYKENLKQYPYLEIKEIDTLITYGKKIETLISIQFVKKVIDLINSGEYTIA